MNYVQGTLRLGHTLDDWIFGQFDQELLVIPGDQVKFTYKGFLREQCFEKFDISVYAKHTHYLILRGDETIYQHKIFFGPEDLLGWWLRSRGEYGHLTLAGREYPNRDTLIREVVDGLKESF